MFEMKDLHKPGSPPVFFDSPKQICFISIVKERDTQKELHGKQMGKPRRARSVSLPVLCCPQSFPSACT